MQRAISDDTLERYLGRLRRTLVALTTAIAIGLTAAAWAWNSQRNAEDRHHRIAELADATELDATVLESATRLHAALGDALSQQRGMSAATELRADLDTLRDSTRNDTVAHDLVLQIDASLAKWDEGFGKRLREPFSPTDMGGLRSQVIAELDLFEPARERLHQLQKLESEAYSHLVEEHAKMQRKIGVGILASIAIIVLLLFELRRRLQHQLGAAREANVLIRAQNDELRSQRDDLKSKTDQLTVQAAELDDQRAKLQEQAVELEGTIHELEEGERRQAALTEDARHLNRRLTVAQHVAQLGYWEIDAADGSVFWSDEMYFLIGATPGVQPPPTDEFLAAVHPEDQENMQRIAADALSELRPFTATYRLRNTGGAYRTMHAEGRAFTEGQSRKLVGTVQDISDRIILEGQLRQAQKMEAVGRLAGGVAHDFNNMLTVVMSCAQMARESAIGNTEIVSLADEIIGAGEQAAGLTRQLLMFSRSRLVHASVVDVNSVVRDMKDLLTRLIGEDVHLAIDLAPEPLPVYVDAHQLGQVVMNLVVNARDAMPGGGKLSIRTLHTTKNLPAAVDASTGTLVSCVLLSVTDDGIGMDAETATRIFEPFFSTKAEGVGTGLGLSTTFGIVQQAGGVIDVVSTKDRGTTFNIFLPLDSTHAVGRTNITAVSEVAHRVRNATVLLVEDDAVVRRATSRMMRRLGYTILEAEDGATALGLMSGQPIDIVVSDTVMPNMSGPELARRLVAERPHLPIILTSGYTADAVRGHGPIPDVVATLEKPFSAAALDRAIQASLAQRQN